MLIAKKVVFWVFPSHAIKKGSNMLSSDGYVKLEKTDFPVLDIGCSYILEITPYTFDGCKESFTSATIDVHSIEYHEADGGQFLITCVANPRGYAGLCLAYSETAI